LFDGSKQIVLTSDAPPSDIANLEKRLISRFEWGLIAELLPPDVETRLAILRHKAICMEVKPSHEVMEYIATNIRSNVRRLEGALTRVGASATLLGRSPSLEQIEKLLKDILQQEASQTVSIDLIQRRVAETYDVRLADMTSKRRPATVALPRQVAMYISRRLTAHSLTEIGAAFGGRDHGTVLHASKTVEQKMESNTRLRQTVTFLMEKLSSKTL
jgi:chromosomal replication initiator protein